MKTSDMKMTVTLDKDDVELAVKAHVSRLMGIPEDKIASVKINVGTKEMGGPANYYTSGVFKDIEVVVKGEIPNDGKLKAELQELAELERKGLSGDKDHYYGFDPH